LLDSVSHELKTPLAVLRSAAESVDTADAGRRTALAGEIRTAAQRLDRLVANLLNQTRLEAGAVRAQLAPCDVRDLIAAARRMMQGPLAGRSIQIEIPPDLGLVSADAALMEHVLGNLLLNAATYSPADQPIRVGAGVAPQGHIFISVADGGPGISAELRGTLFEKFQRGKHAAAGGVGLGLAIVRGFMLAQHGEVSADNQPGGGAVFRVFLPAWSHEEVPVE
jgi:two-component system sensor histidine kinase KdpD